MEQDAVVADAVGNFDRADLVVVVWPFVLPNEDSCDPHLVFLCHHGEESKRLEARQKCAAQLLETLRGIVERLEHDALSAVGSSTGVPSDRHRRSRLAVLKYPSRSSP
jgi:hypothetical protein